MRWTLLLPLVLLACNRPSPGMVGAVSVQGQAAGYDVTLWRAGDRVEIIRHGYAPRADQPALRPAMADAIVTLTGCQIRKDSLEGDSGVLRAQLSCG
jgi:hypothetical protein